MSSSVCIMSFVVGKYLAATLLLRRSPKFICEGFKSTRAPSRKTRLETNCTNHGRTFLCDLCASSFGLSKLEIRPPGLPGNGRVRFGVFLVNFINCIFIVLCLSVYLNGTGGKYFHTPANTGEHPRTPSNPYESTLLSFSEGPSSGPFLEPSF